MGWITKTQVGFGLWGAVIALAIFAVTQERPAGIASGERRVVKLLKEEVEPFFDTQEAGKLPQIDLVLSRNDDKHFRDIYKALESGPEGLAHYQRHNVWRKAEMVVDGRRLRVQIKAQGKDPSQHRWGEFISYTVKVRRQEVLWGAKRFNLVVYTRLAHRPDVLSAIATAFDVRVQQHKLVRVRINGSRESVYFFEWRLDDAFMEVAGLPSWTRLSGAGMKSLVHTSENARRPSSREIAYLATQALMDAQRSAAGLGVIRERYVALHEAIASCDVDQVGELFDLAYLTRFEAMRRLGGLVGHGFTESNFFLFLNTANGRFYPVLSRDNWLDTLPTPTESGPLEAPLGRARFFEPEFDIDVLRLWQRHDALRIAAYRHLVAVLGASVTQVSMARELRRSAEVHRRLVLAPVFQRWLQQVDASRQIAHNKGVLVGYLRHPIQPLLRQNVSGSVVSLELEPGSTLGVVFDRLLITGVSTTSHIAEVTMEMATWTGGKRAQVMTVTRALPCAGGVLDATSLVAGRAFTDGFGPRGETAPRRYVLRLALGDSTSEQQRLGVSAQLVHAITRVVLHPSIGEVEGRELVVGEDRRDNSLPPREGTEARAVEAPLRWSGSNEVTLGPGDVSVETDLFIPPGVALSVPAGTRLRLAPGVCIQCQGDVRIVGTQDQPVRIFDADSASPFGSFAVLGGGRAHVAIKHLRLSGGSEAWRAGAFFSGALSIHQADTVTIEHSRFEGAHADDAVNVKDSRVRIADCALTNNSSDHLDLDVCSGVVERCSFVASGLGGDGLDISHTSLVARDNVFRDCRDKGVSVGERSCTLLLGNRVEGCNIGVAAKDGSIVLLANGIWTNNEADVAAYVKKPVFGGARVWLLDASSTTLKSVVDRQSTIGQIPAGTLAQGFLAKPADRMIEQLHVLRSQFPTDMPRCVPAR